jgi:hypothetical protein
MSDRMGAWNNLSSTELGCTYQYYYYYYYYYYYGHIYDGPSDPSADSTVTIYSSQIACISHPPSFAPPAVYLYHVETSNSDFIFVTRGLCVKKLTNSVLLNLRLIHHSLILSWYPMSSQFSVSMQFHNLCHLQPLI